MSVSVRPYTSAPLAMLTAGVVLSGAALSGAALVSAPGAQAAPSLLKSGYHLGIDTIGQTLKNANLQIRSQPPNPQLNTGPWNQSLAVGVDAAAVAVTFSASLITYVRAGNIGQDNLYNSFAAVASAPSVMAAVARFNTDWALLFNRSDKWIVHAPVLAAILNALIKIDKQLGYSQNSLTDVVDNTPPVPEAKSPLVESWAQLEESWVQLTSEVFIPGRGKPRPGKESWAPATPVAEAPAAVVVDRYGRLRGGVVRPSLPVASLASRARAASLAPAGAATLVAVAPAAVVADEPAVAKAPAVADLPATVEAAPAVAESAPVAQSPAGSIAETSDSTPATKPVNQRTARKAAASRG